MKRFFSISAVIIFCFTFMPRSYAQADSVIVNVGNGSRVLITIRDKEDLKILKGYDFQALINDLITKVEARDTSKAAPASDAYFKNNESAASVRDRDREEEEEWKRPTIKYSDSDDKDWDKGKKYYRGTSHSVAFDLGTSNYLEGGKFTDPEEDLYTVRPWGSWYLAANWVHRTRMARTFFFEWGYGLAMHNFKFQKDNVTVSTDGSSVNFNLDERDFNFRKSKLSVLYLNLSLVPVIDFGGNRKKPILFDGRGADSFRFGIGPYAGYRIDSFTKQVYTDDGDKEKDRDHGSYYLNNFRYGVRLQFGLRNTDFFFNYDLNELFLKDKGPKLNAFSFGVSF